MTETLAAAINEALTSEATKRSKDGYSNEGNLFETKIHRGSDGQILLDITLPVVDILNDRFAHDAREDVMRDLSRARAGSFHKVRQNEVTDHGVTLHRFSAHNPLDIVRAVNQVLSPIVGKLAEGQALER